MDSYRAIARQTIHFNMVGIDTDILKCSSIAVGTPNTVRLLFGRHKASAPNLPKSPKGS